MPRSCLPIAEWWNSYTRNSMRTPSARDCFGYDATLNQRTNITHFLLFMTKAFPIHKCWIINNTSTYLHVVQHIHFVTDMNYSVLATSVFLCNVQESRNFWYIHIVTIHKLDRFKAHNPHTAWPDFSIKLKIVFLVSYLYKALCFH